MQFYKNNIKHTGAKSNLLFDGNIFYFSLAEQQYENIFYFLLAKQQYEFFFIG